MLQLRIRCLTAGLDLGQKHGLEAGLHCDEEKGWESLVVRHLPISGSWLLAAPEGDVASFVAVVTLESEGSEMVVATSEPETVPVPGPLDLVFEDGFGQLEDYGSSVESCSK